MMKRFLLLLTLILSPLLLPMAATAQEDVAELSAQVEDDRGFLTRLLEDNLSSAGRSVRITGFRGALSSRAMFDELTIADDQGVWLTIRNGAIQWNRAALLRKRIEIGELSAETILIPRSPVSEDTGVSIEVGEFRLPELPVAVQIDHIAANRVEIGPTVFGAEAVMALDGKMTLAGGEGDVDLTAKRLDAARGELALQGRYSNVTRELVVDLLLDEDADGLAANILEIPERPSVILAVSGTGPIDDFTAQVRLATDEVERVQGTISTARALGPTAEGKTPGRRFRAALSGDISPLIDPKSRAFFSQESQLLAEGWRGDDGHLSVPVLMVRTGGANLSGSLDVPPGGMPQQVALLLNVAPGATPDQRTALPFGDITLRSGRLSLTFDRAEGSGWILDGRLTDLKAAGVAMRTLRLAGDGTLGSDPEGGLGALNGVVDFAAAGIVADDPKLGQAIGDFVSGRTGLAWVRGGAFRLEDLAVIGDGLTAEGGIDFESPGKGLVAKTSLTATYEDFGRLSGLVGRPLGGAAEVQATGAYTVLTGAFDGRAEVKGTDITVDQEQLDKLLRGTSRIALDAKRDADGIALRGLTIDAEQLVATANGVIRTGATDVTANLKLTDLTTLDPAYGGTLTADAKLTETKSGAGTVRRLSLNGISDNLRVGVVEIDSALRGTTNLVLLAQETGGKVTIETFRAANPQLTAEVKGVVGGGASDATAMVDIPDLTALGREWAGALKADAELIEGPEGRRLTVTGTGQNLVLGQQDLDGALTGTTTFDLAALEKDGGYTIERFKLNNAQMNATAQGTIGGGKTDATAQLNIANLAAFGRGWRGAVQADARFADDGSGARRLSVTGSGTDLSLGQANVDGALVGRTDFTVQGVERDGTLTLETARIDNRQLKASATGQIGRDRTDLNLSADVGDLSALGLGLRGAVSGTGTVQGRGADLAFTAQGNARNLSTGQAQADAVLAGSTSFDLAGRREGGVLRIDRLRAQNPQIAVNADGVVDGGTRRLNVDARLNDLALLAEGFPGPATVTGTVTEQGANYALDLRATAPGDTNATISGTVAGNGQNADLRINGTTDAALASQMMDGRAIDGLVGFDLRMNGAPGLDALSGRISADNLRIADPALGISLPRVSITGDLGGGRVTVAGSADVAAGGTITVAGPVDLSGGNNADLAIKLDDVHLRDPDLYETRAWGDLRLSGPLSGGGAMLRGTVELGETEIRIPSTGLGSSELLTGIEHRGDRPPVRATRERARLEGTAAKGRAGTTRAGSGAIGLDVTVNSDNRVFVRGRGLDAELGGSIRLSGTSADIRPVGELQMIRGRLDILGKRFVLSEGRISLDGALIPYIRFVATTQNNDVTSNVIIDGPANEPKISFSSVPEMAEEEVIAQLLFSRRLDNISAFQAAQLASAIATLAGKGGEGIVGKLRGSFGLDDLDVSTDDKGEVSVRAGKYLSDNLYTDVEVKGDGNTKLNLNLDITPSLKARGSVGSDGNSSVGVFFERDY